VAGTQKLDVEGLSYFLPFVFNRKLYFSTYAPGDNSRFSLNVVVGDTLQTRQVSAPAPVFPSMPLGAEAFRGDLYIAGKPSDGSTGSSLYRFDGRRLTEIIKLTGVPGDVNLWVAGGALFITHLDESSDMSLDALWRSDGTAGGTVLMSSTKLSYVNPGPGGLIGFRDVIGSDLDVYNIPAVGEIALIGSFPHADYHSGAGVDGTIGKFAYFSFQNKDLERELWRTDGTATGTGRILASPPGIPSLGFMMLTVGGKAYFAAMNAKGGSSLFVTDATTSNPTQLTPNVSGGPQGIDVINGKVVFSFRSNSRSNTQLYQTNGTTAGTKLLSSILLPQAERAGLIVVNSHLYVWAIQSHPSTRQLWRLYFDESL
jgi:ELWxxDGT repeat protein